jgi:hypothetical protein
MSETSNHIAKAKLELVELENLKADLSDKKVSFTPHALGLLMQTIRDGIEEMCDNQREQKNYDDTLGKQIGEAVEKAITNFTKLPPQKAPVVNISSPQVNVDLKPLQSIASDITQQNKNLILALEKNNSSDLEMCRLMSLMIQKQNTIIESMVSLLNKPEEVEKERPLVDKLTVTKDQYGKMVMIPQYKK